MTGGCCWGMRSAGPRRGPRRSTTLQGTPLIVTHQGRSARLRFDGAERYFVGETEPAPRTMPSTTSSMKWRVMAVMALREADMRLDGWVEIDTAPVPATRARMTGAPGVRLTRRLSLRRFRPTPKLFPLRARPRPPARSFRKAETVRCAIAQPIQAAECAARMILTTWSRASEPFERCFPALPGDANAAPGSRDSSTVTIRCQPMFGDKHES